MLLCDLGIWGICEVPGQLEVDFISAASGKITDLVFYIVRQFSRKNGQETGESRWYDTARFENSLSLHPEGFGQEHSCWSGKLQNIWGKPGEECGLGRDFSVRAIGKLI